MGIGVSRHDVNRSAGRSAFVGNTSSAPHGARTMMSLSGRPDAANVLPLPAGEDPTDETRSTLLLAGDGAGPPLDRREAGGGWGPLRL